MDVVAEEDPERESRALCVRLTVPDRVPETVQVAESVLIRVAVVVPVRVGVVVRDRTEDGVPLRDPDYDEEPVDERDNLEDTLLEGERHEVADTLRLRLPEAVYVEE